MNSGIIFISIAAALSIAFVVIPLLRKDATQSERVALAANEEIEVSSRRDMVLASLRDLEEDHSAGKVTDEDYEDLHSRLTHEAVELMKRSDKLENDRETVAKSKTIRHPRSSVTDKSAS